MAIFRAQVNYRRGLVGKWSNVWHIEATDLLTASNALNTIGVPALLDILDSACELVSLLVSDPDTNAFVTTPVNLFGTSSASGELLPLFNSMKLLFPSPSFGRPDYKFIKGFVVETITDDGTIIAGTITAVETIVQAFLDDMSDAAAMLVSANGEQYTSVTVQPAVQMRQMHRKRRRTTPAP